ncbi:hypothetical protein KEJ47_10005 [Candidatus Bathyarchaeota archaeon]|nr:hypothetical protein [Candidatus Bathyarchaeota archaeon]
MRNEQRPATRDKVESVVFRGMAPFPSTTYATFGLYRYPAKFIPHVVAYVLKEYASPGMKIFDPFAGYGTVGVVSRIYGYDYELWDLNPMIEILHSIAVMKPIRVMMEDVFGEIASSREEFTPRWSRINYWFPEKFLPLLRKVWGYYHSLPDNALKNILTIPLLKATRFFSYDDMQRQKLSKSLKSQIRISELLSSNWEEKFFQLLKQELIRVMKGIQDYHRLSPKNTRSVVKGGVDTFTNCLEEEKDILITSPPYLQSQEYIRQAKLDLFWLGFTEEEVKRLSRLEIPYRDIEPYPTYSKTFLECEQRIREPHIRKIFDRYFWGVLGSLSRLQEKISTYLFLFVGHTSTRGMAIPIDKIFIEHFTELEWEHVVTLIDKIVSRRLFDYQVNPATGKKDARTPVENLVVLKRS